MLAKDALNFIIQLVSQHQYKLQQDLKLTEPKQPSFEAHTGM